MAVNESRSMNGEFYQGEIDNTYIQVDPNRGGSPSTGKLERLSWPTYAQAERHADPPFGESRLDRLPLPRERKTRSSGDMRF